MEINHLLTRILRLKILIAVFGKKRAIGAPRAIFRSASATVTDR